MSEKQKYKVIYDRKNCIGVLTCVAFHPERWQINKEDSKADLVGGKEESEGIFILEFTAEELDKFKSAAEVCPVRVIKIFDLESGKEVV